MNIVLTGGTGFIGEAVVKELQRSDHEISLIVRKKVVGFMGNIQQVQFDELGDVEFAHKYFENCDVVIHLAGVAHLMNSNDRRAAEYMAVNRDLTLDIAMKAASAGVKRFVYMSSIAVNGFKSNKPFVETDTPNPIGLYAQSKYYAECGLFALSENIEVNMDVVIIRPPMVYGLNAPGNFKNLRKWVCKPVPLPFGGIKNRRSFVGLDNLVDFVILCCDFNKSPAAANQVFLISDGEDLSTSEFITKVSNSSGGKCLLVPIPVFCVTLILQVIGKKKLVDSLLASLQIKNTKARKLLGWKPVTSMKEQLQQRNDVREK
jgi:nucleoside-diphosphate-sugar epimerase